MQFLLLLPCNPAEWAMIYDAILDWFSNGNIIVCACVPCIELRVHGTTKRECPSNFRPWVRDKIHSQFHFINYTPIYSPGQHKFSSGINSSSKTVCCTPNTSPRDGAGCIGTYRTCRFGWNPTRDMVEHSPFLVLMFSAQFSWERIH